MPSTTQGEAHPSPASAPEIGLPKAVATPRLALSFAAPGLLLGSLFFGASLAPSLVPRSFSIQGVLSGCSFAAGYGLGVLLGWLWLWLELPSPRPRTRRWVRGAAVALALTVVAAFSWQASGWQDSVRIVMGLDPVERIRPLEVAAIAAGVFALWIAFARTFRLVVRAVSARLHRHVPRRVSSLIGMVVTVALTWAIVDGVLFRLGLRALDKSYQQVDEFMESDIARPTDPARTGSGASLLAWEKLGRAGRDFVASVPSGAEIGAFFEAEAVQPVRVYVGLNAGESVEQRARLALDELVRTGGFDRSVLVIVTPTGTGWIDPGAITTLEYLHRGDVASVAVQYSYLSSWLTLLVEPGYGAESARALFNEVYGYWTRLPKESRPRLYLHGLSLGAMNSDLSADLWDVIGDPFHGALWSGPPFTSPTWKAVTSERAPGSPYWLPTFRDGSIVRFLNQEGAPHLQDAAWGPMRIVYLQYASVIP